MNCKIETVMTTGGGIRIFIEQYDSGGVFVNLHGKGSSMYMALNIADAKQLLANLQEVIDAELTE